MVGSASREVMMFGHLEQSLAQSMSLPRALGRTIHAAKKKGLADAKPLSFLLVPVTGIELVTFALRMRCSTN